MNEAIVAKLGLDVKNFRDGLSSVATYTASAHGQMAKSAHGNAEAHEELFKSENRVERNLIGLSRNLATASSGYETAAASAEALTESLHLPLAVGASIGIAIVAYEKLHEAIEGVEAAAHGAQDTLAATHNSGGSGQQGAREGLGMLDAAQQKLENSRTYTAAIADTFLQMAGHASVLNEGLEKSDQLEERRLEINAELAKMTREEAEARQIGASRSAEEGESALARLAAEQKLAQLRGDASLGVDARHALVEAAEQEGAETQKTIARKYEASRREIAAAREILTIQSEGRDVDVRVARVHVQAAEQSLLSARTREESEQRTLALAQAYVALTNAQKKQTQENAALAIEEKIVRLKGEADTKQLAELKLRGTLLEQQFAQATDDEKRKLQLEIDRNRTAQKSLQENIALRRFETEAQQIAAEQGLGQAEQLRALNRTIALDRAKVAALAASENSSAQDEATAAAKTTSDLKARAELLEQIASRQRGVTAENAELQARLAHHGQIAQALALQADYAEKIREAEKNGNPELAQALGLQRQLKLEILAQSIAEQNQQRYRFGLHELAQGHGKAGQQARQVERLEERAQKEAFRGHEGKAHQLYDQADALRKQIGLLRDSEKMLDQFSGALDKAQVLKDIETNTRNGGKNR